MFRPVALYIGLRYTRAKRRNYFISFISWLSMLGIALGVIVLITVLSVMNGFDREIKTRIFGMQPAITVSSGENWLSNWQELATLLQHMPHVQGVAPYVETEVLLTNNHAVEPALIRGISPTDEKTISALSENMVTGQLNDLVPGQFNVIIGEGLASRLNVVPGDKITVVTPQVSLTPAGVLPRIKRFTVTGVFSTGGGFGFDSMLAFIQLSDAQKLIRMGDGVTGLHVKIDNVFQAPEVTQQLSHALTGTARITNWTEIFGAFFDAIRLEKTMMFLILMLIVAVAAFNLVSTLVMVVTEKEADIAILRTLGATPRMIMMIFIVQGAAIGIVGSLLGIVGGIALATHVTPLVNALQRVFHLHVISSQNYLVDYLPSELLWSDVSIIAVCTLALSLLATLYPAWRAAKTEPVEALRYE